MCRLALTRLILGEYPKGEAVYLGERWPQKHYQSMSFPTANAHGTILGVALKSLLLRRDLEYYAFSISLLINVFWPLF
jgi:hypothetical protein